MSAIFITSNHDALSNETVFTDTSSGTFDVTFPSMPSLGSKVTIIDAAGSFNVNALRIISNGGKINGSAISHLDLVFKHSVTVFYYSGVNYGWIYNITRMWAVEGGTF